MSCLRKNVVNWTKPTKKNGRKNTQNEKLHPGILFLTVHTGSINQYIYLTMDGDSPGFHSWAWHSHILYDYIDIYVERECKTGGWIFLMNTFFFNAMLFYSVFHLGHIYLLREVLSASALPRFFNGRVSSHFMGIHRYPNIIICV